MDLNMKMKKKKKLKVLKRIKMYMNIKDEKMI